MITVADVWQDASSALGDVDSQTTYRRLNDAIELLSNLTKWRSMEAYADLEIECGNCVTLPYDIATPMGVAVDCVPAFARDKLFEFHINGPGPRDCQVQWAWDDRGDVPTLRAIQSISTLLAIPESNADQGKRFIAICDDANDREFELAIPMSFSAPTPTSSSTPVKRIKSIQRDPTARSVKLYAIDVTTSDQTLIGWYYPFETVPSYRRIKVRGNSTVRMLYKRRSREVRSPYCIIPLNSRMAIIQAVRAVKARLDNNLEGAIAYEMDAKRLLEMEESANETPSSIGPQIQWHASRPGERLRGGGRRGYYGNPMRS